VQGLDSGDLSIQVSEQPNALVCAWTGKSNDRNPQAALGPWFDGLLAAAAAKGASVTMHFDKLDHFNSSTITALIRLIQGARGKGVKLTFVYDQNLKWQRLSFDALRVFEKADRAFELVTA